ncbi:MAG: adenosylcobinamide amidohydrolase [Deltaproteobacteria bacterium]|jgi:adenosylcobinamide amidohydrolase|nr:adenosylcobinamide amidohydrolase [Deltaproteobacteria bacterium]
MPETMHPERLTAKILLEQTPDHLHVQFDTGYRVLSSAVLNGGFVEASHILNLKVAKHTAGSIPSFKPPAVELSGYCQKQGWQGTAVGMMTAASMDSYRMVKTAHQGVDLIVLVTAGLSNARRAGDHAEHRDIMGAVADIGTINIICLTSAGMTPAAMIEAVMTVTEAKAAALQNLDIKSQVSGGAATGTGTDAIAVAADPQADKIPYCGKHVLFGELLANLVIDAVTSSIRGARG